MFEKAGGKNPETIAVIRHPVEWRSSWYRYRNRHSLVGHENSTRNVKLNEFVLEYCKDDPRRLPPLDRSRLLYLIITGNGRRPTCSLTIINPL